MTFAGKIKKLISILLLLILSQKMGAGLYLHNLFHTKDYKHSSTLPNNKSVKFACNCIDDFTTLFAETEILELSHVTPFYFDHNSIYKWPISASFHFFNSLRAPPSDYDMI
jgi:hypothetical protein